MGEVNRGWYSNETEREDFLRSQQHKPTEHTNQGSSSEKWRCQCSCKKHCQLSDHPEELVGDVGDLHMTEPWEEAGHSHCEAAPITSATQQEKGDLEGEPAINKSRPRRAPGSPCAGHSKAVPATAGAPAGEPTRGSIKEHKKVTLKCGIRWGFTYSIL